MRNAPAQNETESNNASAASQSGAANASMKVAVETTLRLAAARDELLTLAEVDRLMKWSRTSGWRRRNRKRNPLPMISDGGIKRVRRGDLEDWIKSQPKLAVLQRESKK